MWYENGNKFRGLIYDKVKEFKDLSFPIYFRTFIQILLDSEMKEISLILISMNLISDLVVCTGARRHIV